MRERRVGNGVKKPSEYPGYEYDRLPKVKKKGGNKRFITRKTLRRKISGFQRVEGLKKRLGLASMCIVGRRG